jgi:hypothetical protein
MQYCPFDAEQGVSFFALSFCHLSKVRLI